MTMRWAMKMSGLLLVLLPWLTGCGVFETRYLVEEGQPRAEIIVAEQPTRMSQLAAEELQTYVRKISGAELPIVSQPSNPESVRLYVGPSDHTRQLGLSIEGLDHGAFQLKSGDNWLAFMGQDADFVPPETFALSRADSERAQALWREKSGGDWSDPVGGSQYRQHSGRTGWWEYDQRGSLNAVYAFLRQQGVRWYMAGELGEVLPEAASIELPDIDQTVHPAYPLRSLQFALAGTTPRDDLIWRFRLGGWKAPELIGTGGGIAHEMRALMRNERMKQEHPEYYALWGGQRMTEGNGKPCLSAAGLKQENVEFVRAIFEVYDTPMVSVMPQDGYGRACQCELCEGKETPDRGYHGNISDYVWTYVNDVAKEVYKTHPDKKISCFAYGAYLLPPETIDKLSPNIVVGIVHGRSGKFRDPNTRARAEEIRQRWAELSSHKLIMWEHYPFTHRGTFYPVYFTRQIADSLGELQDVSMGDFVELPWGPMQVRGHGLHTPGFSHLNLYVTAHYYWFPDSDLDQLLDGYFRRFYGPAAEQMKAYVAYAEEHWAAMKDEADKIERVLALLREAEAQVAPDSVYGQRIALLTDYLRPLEDLAEQLTVGRDDMPAARARSVNPSDLVIDGQLDEPFWDDLINYPLWETQTGSDPGQPTTFKVAWLGNAIVFGIRCQDVDMSNLNIGTTKDEDRNIWLGDVLELHLETQSHAYYQLAVSPSGALVDLDRKHGLNFQWSSQAEVATSQDEDGWTVEIRIPVVEGDMPDDPNHDVVGRRPLETFPWYFNVARQRVRGDVHELSAFSPTGKKGLHDRMKFGKLYVR